MSDPISIPELRALEPHQWGPFPWDERDAGALLVEVPQAALLALVEAIEAAKLMVAPGVIYEIRGHNKYGEVSNLQANMLRALEPFNFGESA